MASVAHFFYDVENIIDEIESRLAIVEKNAVKKFVCARTIQRIFRGYITRKHIALLHQSATCIQKNWRAFIGRLIYTKRLKEKYDEMCWLYYHEKARVIQKCWRGFWVRLKVFSYYRLKSWLAFVMQQNKILKSTVEAYHGKANVTEMKQREEEAKEWIVYILFKLHHLLRTHQITGIYSLPNTAELSEIEKLLKCLKYKDFMIFYNSYMEDLRQHKIKEVPPSVFQNYKKERPDKNSDGQKKPEYDFLFSGEPYSNPPLHGKDTYMELRNEKKMRFCRDSIDQKGTEAVKKCPKCCRTLNKEVVQ